MPPEPTKTPAEFQRELADKAIELNVQGSALMANGYTAAGLSAMWRGKMLADWAEEISKPPRIIIIVCPPGGIL